MVTEGGWIRALDHTRGEVYWWNPRHPGVTITDLQLTWAYNYNAFFNEFRDEATKEHKDD